VRWADELIVVDQCSTDATQEICRAFGARVMTRDMTEGFGEQKNYAINQATQPWILSLDADEVVTEELRIEIERVLRTADPLVGYRMPRLTNYLGRFIRHCGWYPRPVLRLFRRGQGRFTDARVHEELLVDGPVGNLHGDLLHFSYDTSADHIRKLLLYSGLDAHMVLDRGMRFRPLTWFWYLACQPVLIMVRKYLLQGGIREGREGLILSIMAGIVSFVTYAKAWSLTQEASKAT
jgi:glycosyltransferase involved in cell wall biosynthesis